MKQWQMHPFAVQALISDSAVPALNKTAETILD
jgi:hypothetical protein